MMGTALLVPTEELNSGSFVIYYCFEDLCASIYLPLKVVPVSDQTLGRKDKETDPLSWSEHIPAKQHICPPVPASCLCVLSSMASYIAEELYITAFCTVSSWCSWMQHWIVLRMLRQGYAFWLQLSKRDMGSHCKTCCFCCLYR